MAGPGIVVLIDKNLKEVYRVTKHPDESTEQADYRLWVELRNSIGWSVIDNPSKELLKKFAEQQDNRVVTTRPARRKKSGG